MKRIMFCWVVIISFLYSCEKEVKPNQPDTHEKYVLDLEHVTYVHDVKRVIDSRCITCHDAESSLKLDTYFWCKEYGVSGQLAGSLNGDLNYTQMKTCSGIDSLQTLTILSWVKQGMSED